MEASIEWGTAQGRAILMIPGPTELPWSVVQAMNQPPTIQYDMSFDTNVLEPTTLALRDVFQAPKGEVIVMPGMGITANPMYVLPTLSALELTLRDLGHRCESGAGVAAAQTVFSAKTA